ncbi:MAG: hypothetical protein ACK5OX_10245 [Desertimonas sp.]
MATSGPTTTTVPNELILDTTGLGVADYQAPADEVVATLTGLLGEPTEDTGWVDPITIGTCLSNEARRVSWNSLSVFFGDNGEPGSRQFFTYSYGDVADLGAEPIGLLTPAGIGIGSTIADLRAAYPEVTINLGEEGLIESTFFVDENLGGLVTGDADTDVVTVIYGSWPFCG